MIITGHHTVSADGLIIMLSWNKIIGEVVTPDVSGCEKGTYVISIENKNSVYAGKFLKP